MYNSLKKQKRVHGPTRRTICVKPLKSGRDESTIASSDEGDLIAISNAMRKGQPLYFVRSADGTTLDVILDRAVAIRTRDALRERYQNGRPNINVYERIGTALTGL